MDIRGESQRGGRGQRTVGRRERRELKGIMRDRRQAGEQAGKGIRTQTNK